MSNSTITDNIEGQIRALVTNRQILYGTMSPPVFVTDTTLQIAGEGQVFYQVKPYGADAVVITAWDINGSEITALTGSTIKAYTTLTDRFSAIKLEDQGAGKFTELFVMNSGIPTPPANLVAPVVSGDAETGGSISTTNGTWTGSAASYAFTYQWYLDDVILSGYTDSEITVTPDQGDYTCVVTATNDNGSASQVSNAFTVTDP